MNNFWQGFFSSISQNMFNTMFGCFMPRCNGLGGFMPVSVFGNFSAMNYGVCYSPPSIFSAMPTAMPMPMPTAMQMPVAQDWNFTSPMMFNSFANSNVSWSSSSTTAAKPSKKAKSSESSPSTLEDYKKEYGLTEKTLPNDLKVQACRWSKFDKCQPEWLDLQKYMLQAAEELGLTLVYSDVTRTVEESNKGRAKKGNLVAKGGESPHNYGVAADIVLFKDGKAIGATSDLQKQFANRVKELSGNKIAWGGDWKKKGESHHFELKGWREKYKKPEYLVG